VDTTWCPKKLDFRRRSDSHFKQGRRIGGIAEVVPQLLDIPHFAELILGRTEPVGKLIVFIAAIKKSVHRRQFFNELDSFFEFPPFPLFAIFL